MAGSDEGLLINNHWGDLASAFNLSDPFEYEEYLQTIAELNKFNNVTPIHHLTTLSPAATASTVVNKLYCGDGLESFSKYYRFAHGYISLIVCLFGMFANILNVVVLRRMDQRISPTNAILIALAVADIIVLIAYIPFAFHMYIMIDRPLYERFSYPWTVYVMIHAHVTQVFHTISIWLTVLLAIWRYLYIAYPLRSLDWCTPKCTLIVILLAYVCSPIICIPIFLVYTIQEKPWQQHVLYVLGLSQLAQADDGLLKNLNFWMYSIVVKLIPCLALMILSFNLIQ